MAYKKIKIVTHPKYGFGRILEEGGYRYYVEFKCFNRYFCKKTLFEWEGISPSLGMLGEGSRSNPIIDKVVNYKEEDRRDSVVYCEILYGSSVHEEGIDQEVRGKYLTENDLRGVEQTFFLRRVYWEKNGDITVRCKHNTYTRYTWNEVEDRWIKQNR